MSLIKFDVTQLAKLSTSITAMRDAIINLVQSVTPLPPINFGNSFNIIGIKEKDSNASVSNN